MSEVIFTDVRFQTLDLEPSLMRGVEGAGFDYCTPIQAQALPLALAGTDVEGQAQTGTGKTAAFLLATMNLLLRKERGNRGRLNDPRAMILAPTRELAVQIQKDAEVLGRHSGLVSGVVFGGTGYESQRKMLEDGVDILIGTPGRTIDYLKQRVYGLDAIDVVVMDEADRMFDLGFIKDVRYVLRRMPPDQRLNMLFSATLSHRVSELAYEHMNEPTLVDATPENVTVRSVRQTLYHVSSEEKIPLLLGLLAHRDVSRTIVFTNTKRVAERVTDYLEGNGYDADLLTGDVPQTKRLSLLGRFTEGKLAILVATDVAARGLHIPNVSHVFNYDLPQDAEDYVHRTGRTARAGASGDAVSFACEQYVFSLAEIEAFIGQQIPVEPVTDELLKRPQPPVRRNRTRVSGPRGRGDGKGGGGGSRPRRRRDGGGHPGGGGSGSKRAKEPVGDVS